MKKPSKIKLFFDKIGVFLKREQEDLFEEASLKAEDAVKLIDIIKSTVENPSADFFVSLTNSQKDDKLLELSRTVLPKVAHKMGVMRGVIDESATPLQALYSVIKYLRSIQKPARRSWWIEFSAELAGALLDGKLSFPELISLTQMIFKKLFPAK